MNYRPLGSTDIQVSSFGFGTWMLGREGNADLRECQSMIRTALDSGINLIDTAGVYSDGDAETIVGMAVRGRRHDVVISTKVGYGTANSPSTGGLSRRWISQALNESLRRLGTDYVDIYLLHRPDPTTEIEETMATLDELVRAGKVRVAGCSTYPAWQIAQVQCVCAQNKWSPLRCEQPPYSVLVRAAERDVFPVAMHYGMGVVVWGPLAGGWLTGKYQRDALPPAGSRASKTVELGAANPQIGRRYDLTDPANRSKFEVVDHLEHLARESDMTLAGLALAFTQAHPAVTSTLIGARTPGQLREILSYLDTKLEAAVLDRVDEIVAPGAVLADADRGWDPPWMEATARRR